MTEEGKKEACSTSGCCCKCKCLMTVVAALFLFGTGFWFGKTVDCPKKICPISQTQMQK